MTGTLRLAILGGTMLLATSVTSPASAHDEVSHCEAVINRSRTPALAMR